MTRTRLLAATLLAAVTAGPAPAATTPITQTVWEGRTTDASGKAAATNATYVDSASPNTAFGTATTFNTGGTATGLLSFPTLFSDLGLNPANITITSAKLDLCVPPSVYATGGQYAGRTPGVPWSVFVNISSGTSRVIRRPCSPDARSVCWICRSWTSCESCLPIRCLTSRC